MYYEWDWTIPANTPEDAPIEKIVKLKPGILTEIRIFYPPGCQGLAKVRIFDGTHRLRPLNPEGWIKTDAGAVIIPVWLLMEIDPYELRFELANVDGLWDHTLTVSISVLPRALAHPALLIAQSLRQLAEAMGLEIPKPYIPEVEYERRS